MNKRIRELAEQCETKEVGYYFFDREKFAELIVRECVSTLGCEIVFNDNYTEKNKIISDMMELLKQHFGVEQ
jgi:hypothetical protein